MGEWFQTIADIEASPEEAPRLAASTLAWLVAEGIVVGELTDCALGSGYAPGPRCLDAVTVAAPGLYGLAINGLEVTTERTVFYSTGDVRVSCRGCGNLDSDWDSMSATVDAWHSGGDGVHRCPRCGRHADLNGWTWDPPWGFGQLGFTFWNWPPLSEAFVAEVSRHLGHRTVLPSGKL